MSGMTTRGYTILGWLTWQVGKRLGKRKMEQNKTKLGGGAAAALGVLVLGLVAAKALGGGDDDS